jgi:L-lactate dehydrogenase complex protein LldF
MGVVWTSLLTGIEGKGDLAHACTLNGHCNEVCPLEIPLKEMIRSLREDLWDRGLNNTRERLAMKAWGEIALRPSLYHKMGSIAGLFSHAMRAGKGYFSVLPGGSGWTDTRDMPAFSKRPFHRRVKNSRVPKTK